MIDLDPKPTNPLLTKTGGTGALAILAGVGMIYVGAWPQGAQLILGGLLAIFGRSAISKNGLGR